MEQQQRRETRLRSRGEVRILCEGHPEFSADIYDIGVEGLGILAPRTLPAGSRVHIEAHALSADGVVRHCQPRGESFHIGIALEALPGDPAA